MKIFSDHQNPQIIQMDPSWVVRICCNPSIEFGIAHSIVDIELRLQRRSGLGIQIGIYKEYGWRWMHTEMRIYGLDKQKTMIRMWKHT